jgi:glucose/arabinose dehydrogenase
MVLTAGACSATPSSGSAPPESQFRVVGDGVVFNDWPAVARRAWAKGGGHLGMPAGFVDELVISGLERPTALRFLPDGGLIVTEQAGLVKIHPSVAIDEPRVLIDLRSEVLLGDQLGLLGLGIDPGYAAEPYIYLAYSRDALPGEQAPTYGSPDGQDSCPDRHACPASGRLVRYRLEGAPPTVAGPARVLIDDWCLTGPNHTVGTIAFGSDGALYVGAGDGADGRDLDHGQFAQPASACDDAPSEGGSLRSQDLEIGTDAVGLDGTIVRLDRATGEAASGNPLESSTDRNARRIIANGLRNPFRFDFRPGTDELWIADVGWNSYEEINVLADATPAAPVNFGWPCFEGPFRQSEWEALAEEPCAALYEDESSVWLPAMSFTHGSAGDQACDSDAAATSAMTFYDGTEFPELFSGALFFADMSQRCLYVIEAGADGRPNPATAALFAHPFRAADMVIGPDGALYYAQLVSGEIRRIAWRPT